MNPREIYDEQAARYEAFTQNSFSWDFIERPAFEEQLSRIVPAHARFLDIGCGTGRVLRFLVEQGAVADEVVGLDVSRAMLAHAAASIPSPHLVEANSETLPFKDKSFDFITANMWLHNLDTQQAATALQEIGRVLVPGGRFVCVDTNPRKYAPVAEFWAQEPTPWGTEVPSFVHRLGRLTNELAQRAGLRLQRLYEPPVPLEGMRADIEEYARYTQRPRRIAFTLRKSLLG
jgi:ubiquinone/menaquinone biosynthesis C-methylase UbiE